MVVYFTEPFRLLVRYVLSTPARSMRSSIVESMSWTEVLGTTLAAIPYIRYIYTFYF